MQRKWTIKIHQTNMITTLWGFHCTWPRLAKPKMTIKFTYVIIWLLVISVFLKVIRLNYFIRNFGITKFGNKCIELWLQKGTNECGHDRTRCLDILIIAMCDRLDKKVTETALVPRPTPTPIFRLVSCYQFYLFQLFGVINWSHFGDFRYFNY